jgi:hypothetical protein
MKTFSAKRRFRSTLGGASCVAFLFAPPRSLDGAAPYSVAAKVKPPRSSTFPGDAPTERHSNAAFISERVRRSNEKRSRLQAAFIF